MRLSKNLWLLLNALAFVQFSTLVAAQDVSVSVVSPLEKVFRDTVPVSKTEAEVLRLECAANEYESGQFVIRSNTRLEDVSVQIGVLRSEETNQEIGVDGFRLSFVGYVPVQRNTTEAQCGAHRDIPKGELLRAAPFDCPDPLLEDEKVTVEAGKSQPVWMSAHVPRKTGPGIYRGEIRIWNSTFETTLPVELRVFPFELHDERHLYVTNWFEIGHIGRAHRVEALSDEFWRILGRYARNLAEHHQNVIYTPWRLIKVFREKDETLSFDYADFDRYVTTFLEAGTAERIEIQHVGHHGPEGRQGKEIPLHKVDPIDRETGRKVPLPGDQGMVALLKDLRQHLIEKGWLDRTIIHVSDEPSFHNAEQWKETARLVRSTIPGVKTIDAIEATGFEDALDIMVPQTVNLHTWFDDFKKAQASGTELWFYTCCSPWGQYANRFLDYHLSKTRILHWMNYATGTQGFLHWGLTYDWDDPFGPAPRYPPGDSHIIYPGKEGPMSSIRWEMLREGLEDYEYLWLLESRTRKLMERLGLSAERFPADSRSREICGQLVRSLTDYETDPETFYAVRRELASEIVEIEKAPLVLLAASPNTNVVLETGPAMTKLFGFVEPGTRVTIDGTPAEVNSKDGSFVRKLRLSWPDPTVTIEVERNGERKVLVREFKVR